jgi:hypothetical protein
VLRPTRPALRWRTSRTGWNGDRCGDACSSAVARERHHDAAVGSGAVDLDAGRWRLPARDRRIDGEADDPRSGDVESKRVLCVLLPSVAAIETSVIVITACVVTEKLADVAPVATDTERGTTTVVWLLDNVTFTPEGAAPLRVTVPSVDWPPTRLPCATAS